MNPGHTYRLPSGDAIAAIMRQMWSEQFAALQLAIRLYGRQGVQAVDLGRWQNALIERIIPLYQQYAHDGQLSFAQHVQQPKAVKRGAGVVLIDGTTTKPPTAVVDDYIEVFDPNVANFARAWAYDFAASTLATTNMRIMEVYQRTANTIATSLEQGNTLDQLSQALGFIFNDPARAQMIAASEASRAYHGGQMITAEESGEVYGKTWLASTDACEQCLALNGKTVPLDKPFVVLPGRYGVVMSPPLHPHCVLGETPVRMSTLITAMKAKYNGPVVRLHFSDGSSVRVTPNHMLLSSFGFLRASDFVQGDYVICTGGSELQPLPALDNPDYHDAPPTAHEVFHALRETFGVTASTVPVSAEYLHGDAAFCDGQIDVVRANSLLWNAGDTPFSQPFRHLPLILTRLFGVSLIRGSNLASMLQALLSATDGIVGSRRELSALFRGVSRIADQLGNRTAANGKTEGFQPSHDSRATDAKRLRNVQDAFPGQITTLQVTKIDWDIAHDEPVYDFETEESMYVLSASGIVSSNCMCSQTYELLPSETQPTVAAMVSSPPGWRVAA